MTIYLNTYLTSQIILNFATKEET